MSKDVLNELYELIESRRAISPEKSYVAKMFSKGRGKICQKVGEEATEVVIASKNDDREKFLGEAADLIFHLGVLLENKGVGFSDVVEVLRKRHGTKKGAAV